MARVLPKSPLNLHAHVLAFEQKEGEWQAPPELMDLIKIIGEHPDDAFIACKFTRIIPPSRVSAC